MREIAYSDESCTLRACFPHLVLSLHVYLRGYMDPTVAPGSTLCFLEMLFDALIEEEKQEEGTEEERGLKKKKHSGWGCEYPINGDTTTHGGRCNTSGWTR